MPFALLIIGIVLVTAAVRNTQGDLIVLLANDFSGPNNFVYWVVALILLGAIGYIPKLKGISDGLIVLVLLALVLSRGNPKINASGGFFKQFTDALGTTEAKQAGAATVNVTVPSFQTVSNFLGV